MKEHRFHEAELAFKNLLRIQQKQKKSLPDALMSEYYNFIGVCLHAQGKSGEAIEYYQKGLTSSPKMAWKQHVKLLSNTAMAQSALNKKDAALQSMTKALSLARKHRLPAQDKGVLLNNYGQLLAANSKLSKAKLVLIEAVQTRENLAQNTDRNLISPLNNLALVCIQLNELDEAEGHCKRAISIQEREDDDEALVFASWNNLATIYVRKKKFDEAEKSFENALEIAKMCFGPHSEQALKVSENLSLIYNANGKFSATKQ
ncbi:MAG: tetratricopeptide repeat protein [Candidatus Melainabacteria bacterium]|nr:tetratricopeptide repeat protein [Candidatus Melainabacteria bacterium]